MTFKQFMALRHPTIKRGHNSYGKWRECWDVAQEAVRSDRAANDQMMEEPWVIPAGMKSSMESLK